MLEMLERVFARIIDLGPQRLGLLGLALVFVMAMPFGHAATEPRGLELFFGGILPAAAPIVVVVILFDMLMCHALSGDLDEAGAARNRFVMRADLLVGAVLLGSWLAKFLPLLLG